MITFSKLGKFGRLGNQMFQVAAVLGFAHKHKTQYFIPKWEYAKYFDFGFRYNKRKMVRLYREKDFTYDPIPNWNHLDIEGYFQSEKYFEGLDMRQVFKPSKEIKNYINNKYGKILEGNTVSIHIRRGDYLKLSEYHYNLDSRYYMDALDKFKGENNRLIVFSDDIQWCYGFLNLENITFIEGEKDIVDLFIMSKCKHNIIANSSFSWWGSYLNSNPDKKVIAPTKDKWFGAKMNKSVDDLYLNNWILV